MNLGGKGLFGLHFCITSHYCSSLNVTGSHKLIGSATIRRCDFVGVYVALLEEVCHYGGGL